MRWRTTTGRSQSRTAVRSRFFGNPAAPYVNSLVTPGNPNAAQVSYATRYYNAGQHVHPSEPNYIWSEAGTTFGVYTDEDPSASAQTCLPASISPAR